MREALAPELGALERGLQKKFQIRSSTTFWETGTGGTSYRPCPM